MGGVLKTTPTPYFPKKGWLDNPNSILRREQNRQNRHKTGISLSNSLTKTGINRHNPPILQHYACLAVNSFTREKVYKTGIRGVFREKKRLWKILCIYSLHNERLVYPCV